MTDNTPSSHNLSILNYARKNNLPRISSIVIILCSVVLGLSFFYIFYGKNSNSSPHTATKHDTNNLEVVKKEFTFGIKSPSNSTNNQVAPQAKEYRISKAKPVFKKYRAIPVGKPEETDNVNNNQLEQQTRQLDLANTEIAVAKAINVDPNFLLLEGTYIPCSLTTSFISDVSGHIGCIISEDVYSANGLVKLIEKGSKAIGQYKSGTLSHGVGRMFVIWTRLITPDFKQISLINTQVVGRLGEAGIDGHIDSHFLQRFGGSLMLSVVQDVMKGISQRKSSSSNVVNAYQADHSKDALVAMAEKTLDNAINIPPTMYKKQGEIIGILVGSDIDFSKVYKLRAKNVRP